MGKAAIVGATILLLVIVVGLLLAWHDRSSKKHEDKVAGRPLKGDLSAAQEAALQAALADADKVMIRLSEPNMMLDDASYLTPEHREMIAAWRKRYTKIQEEFKSA